MTCMKCRICNSILIDDVFNVDDETYLRLIKEHAETHTEEERNIAIAYMSPHK